MLTGLAIRDVVLIERLDLSPALGLTALTGETGAGKSIVLDALGLATGARAEAGLVRRGAAQAGATAVFQPPADHPVHALLAEKGLEGEPGEDLVLRRQLSADGRSRAFVNDQPTGVAVLREIGALLVEVHGQHETVGLLDPRTHRPLLDTYAGATSSLAETAAAFRGWRAAQAAAEALQARSCRLDAERETLTAALEDLDRLDPREGEEATLASERALLGGAEKALADIAAAREGLASGAVSDRIAQALRAVEQARERAVQAAGDAGAASPHLARLVAASEALERTLLECQEAEAAIDLAASAFDVEPGALDRAEERLFALRAAARKLNTPVDALPALRARFVQELRGLEDAGAELEAAQARVGAARTAYEASARQLTQRRTAAAGRLAAAVEAELSPLKLERARFRVVVTPLEPGREGPTGADRVAFEVATNPGAPFGELGAIASGGELARFSLALKGALARAGDARLGPVMIFDEVDQGVGGAVADAVGLRLKQLAASAQVLVVTHSPQVAARADVHWRVSKTASGDAVSTTVGALDAGEREEELARMLAGREVTPEARAAARALMGAGALARSAQIIGGEALRSGVCACGVTDRDPAASPPHGRVRRPRGPCEPSRLRDRRRWFRVACV
ncbi:DNA repair protein RecN [soil metagenome]